MDFLGWLLRQIGRHLTAYDLVVFHHRGANYPDAFVLDAALKAYLIRIERRPELFLDEAGDDEDGAKSQTASPSRPSSGLVDPASLRRMARPRLTHVAGRKQPRSAFVSSARAGGADSPAVPPHAAPLRRRSFAVAPWAARHGGAAQSATDLGHSEELRELGMALFLRSALRTADSPLLASEAFSRSIAEQRLRDLAREPNLMTDEQRDQCLSRLAETRVCR